STISPDSGSGIEEDAHVHVALVERDEVGLLVAVQVAGGDHLWPSADAEVDGRVEGRAAADEHAGPVVAEFGGGEVGAAVAVVVRDGEAVRGIARGGGDRLPECAVAVSAKEAHALAVGVRGVE